MKRKAVTAVVVLVVLGMVAPAVPIAVSAQSAQQGFEPVPGGQISEVGIPDEPNRLTGLTGPELMDRARGNVHASDHGETLSAQWAVLNTRSGKFVNDNAVNAVLRNNAGDNHPLRVVFVLADDEAHDGRQVSVPTDLLTGMYGYQPGFAFGAHEDGSTWQDPIDYEDGMATFTVPKFSTNAVTLDEEIKISGSPASDGTSYDYDISSLDAADNFTASVTGVENTETDTVTGSGVTNGGTVDLGVAGNEPATGANVTFTGDGFGSRDDSSSANGVSPSGSISVGVDGNLDPAGQSTSDPMLTVTGYSPRSTQYSSEDLTRVLFGELNGDYYGEVKIDNPPATITHVDLDEMAYGGTLSNCEDYTTTADVYINTNGIDGSTADGTQVATDVSIPVSGFGWSKDIDISNYDASSLSSVTVEFVPNQWPNDCTAEVHTTDGASSTYVGYSGASTSTYQEYPGVELVGEPPVSVSASSDGSNSASASLGSFTDGETKTKQINLASDASSVSFSGTGNGDMDVTAEWTEREGVIDPSVDVDGDGTDEASYSGTLLGGESSSAYSLPDLATGATADVSTSTGAVNPEFAYTEHTVTQDPELVVNGNPTNVTGTLSDGATQSLTTDTAWLQTGTNTLDVNVGDGTPGTDAPPMQVNFDYSHGVTDDRSVDYTSEKFTSVYNFSRTYATDTDQSSVTVPTESDAVGVRGDVEYSINGSAWSAASDGAHSFNNGDLDVDLDAIYGGEIPENTTMEIRFDISKIQVNNGTVSVSGGTLSSDDLDTRLSLDSWNHDSYLSVGGNAIHYGADATWSGEDAYTVIKSGGEQHFYAPNAGDGSEFDIRDLPVDANPSSGEVEISIDEVSESEPRFNVAPGASSGDTVEYTFTEALGGQYYELYSVTGENVRDAGTAQSPLTLTDDDSDEILVFREAAEGGDSSGGGGAGPVAEAADAALSGLQIALIGGVGLFAFAFFVRRRLGDDPGSQSSDRDGIVGRIVGFFRGVLVALSQAIFTGFGAIRSVLALPIARWAIAGVTVIALFALDLVALSSQERAIVLAVSVMLGSFVLLRRFDRFSWGLYAVISASTVIFTLTALGTDLFALLVESPIFPIVGVGAIFLGWRALKAWRQGKETTVTISGDVEE